MNYPFEKCPHFKQSNHDTKEIKRILLIFMFDSNFAFYVQKMKMQIFPQMKIPFFCVFLYKKKYENCLLIQKLFFPDFYVIFCIKHQKKRKKLSIKVGWKAKE